VSTPERLRPRPSDVERCPYCHDALVQTGSDDRVRCEGCGTDHHAGCIAELGRCTVLGCEHPLTAEEAPERGSAKDSQRIRLVRRQVRQRVRSFVREHARSAATYGEMDPRDRPPAQETEPATPPAPRSQPREFVEVLLLVLTIPLLALAVYLSVRWLGT
jgi:hypothetical protein